MQVAEMYHLPSLVLTATPDSQHMERILSTHLIIHLGEEGGREGCSRGEMADYKRERGREEVRE